MPDIYCIAVNPQMRLEMMIENPEEMQLPIDNIMSNVEVKKMTSKVPDTTNTNDDAKMMKKYYSPVKTAETQYKPEIKK